MIQCSFNRSSLGAKLRDRLDPVGWSYCWGMLSWSHRWWNIYITVSFYMYYKHLWHLYSFLGVLPLWVIPAKALGTAPSAPADDNLKYLLAFAGPPLFCLVVFVWSFYHCSPLLLSFLLFGNPFTVGGLLGDVFLHLLPETYQHVRETVFPVTSSFLTTNKIDVCAGHWLWWRGWLVQNWCCHSHRSSCLPRPWEGLSEKLKSTPLSFSRKTTSQTSSSPRCWRWATPRRTQSSEKRKTRRSSATSTCSPTAPTTYCMGLRYNYNHHKRLHRFHGYHNMPTARTPPWMGLQ